MHENLSTGYNFDYYLFVKDHVIDKIIKFYSMLGIINAF